MEALFSAAGSFLLFHFASHPKSKINRKLPKKKIINRIQLLPSIHIEAKNRIFHFHHWMIFTPAFFLFQQVDSSISHASLIQGFLIGGIIQGLLYADRFKVIFRYNDYHKVKRSSYNLSFLRKLI